MLKLDISRFDNIVEPDQLASKKPANQDPHCFLLCKFHKKVLTITMLKLDISYFDNNEDPDQLPSKKPAGQDPHC